MAPYSKVQVWREAGATEALFHDLEWGIHVETWDHVPANFAPNYRSLDERPEAVRREIEALQCDGKVELVPANEIESTVISPLGQVPKPDPEKVCIIHDLSLFMNDSVITRDLTLPTIEDFLCWLTPGAWMWKRDWYGGYTQIWLHRDSRRLMGFWWDDRAWRYCVLPFGASNVVADFCQFSEFVCNSLRHKKIVCWSYIDDLYGLNTSYKSAL